MLGYLTIHGGPCSTIVVHSPHQRTPLHWAADTGHVHVVRYLVEQGTDINNKNDFEVSEQKYT